MAKKRVYVPINDGDLKTIKEIGKLMDRSDAYIASKLIQDGFRFNAIAKYPIDCKFDVVSNFKENHK